MRISRDYEGLREALRPELRDAEDEILDEELDLELAEVLDVFGRALKTVGPAAQRAAPGAIQGALTGFQVGGPWGALIGAGAGAALGATPRPAPATTGAPAAQQQVAIANPAAVQLLALLSRPEVIQALQALALGPAGAPTVPVANVPVPVGAVANLIQSLAESAAVHHHVTNTELRYDQQWSRHVETILGEHAVDPSARGAALLALLADAAAPLEELDESDDEAELAELHDLADLARLEAHDGPRAPADPRPGSGRGSQHAADDARRARGE